MNLDCCDLTTLPPEIGQLTALTHLHLDFCPIDYIPPNVQRFLDRMDNRRRQAHHNGVYGDSQSVHNHRIQTHIRQSIMNLLRDPKPPSQEKTMEMIYSSTLQPRTKQQLTEYVENDAVHSTLDLTFGDVLSYVVLRVSKHRLYE